MDPEPSLLELTRTSPPAPALRPSGLVRSALHSASHSGWVGPSLTLVVTSAITGAVVITVVEPNEPLAPPAAVARTLSVPEAVPPTARPESTTTPQMTEPAPIEVHAEPLAEAQPRPPTPRAAAVEARRTSSTLRVDDSLDDLGGNSLEEVRLVQDVRHALRRHDLATAQASIDEHRRRFPRGALRPEREALRAELLVQRGDCPGAFELAWSATDGPYANRLERLVMARCGPDARNELPAPRPSSAHLDAYFAHMPNDPCAREADDERANRCLVRTLRGDDVLELRTIALAYAALGRRAEACRAMARYQDEYGTIGGRAFRTYVGQHCPDQ